MEFVKSPFEKSYFIRQNEKYTPPDTLKNTHVLFSAHRYFTFYAIHLY